MHCASRLHTDIKFKLIEGNLIVKISLLFAVGHIGVRGEIFSLLTFSKRSSSH